MSELLLETRQDRCDAAFAAFAHALSVTPAGRQAGIADATSTLFLLHADTLDATAAALFERMFLLQIERSNNVEELISLSTNAALLDRLPINVVRALASNEAVAVASPVLTHCLRLTDADLIDLAGRLGQTHLVAIASRETVHNTVTEVLMRRGGDDVVDRLAVNSGAHFKRPDFAKLLRTAQTDDRGRVVLCHPADLLNANGKSFGHCLISDMTPSGAQLKFSSPTPMPQSFSLLLGGVEQARINCKPAWRSGDTAGIQFVPDAIELWDVS